jgi:hypothetical protein
MTSTVELPKKFFNYITNTEKISETEYKLTTDENKSYYWKPATEKSDDDWYKCICRHSSILKNFNSNEKYISCIYRNGFDQALLNIGCNTTCKDQKCMFLEHGSVECVNPYSKKDIEKWVIDDQIMI